MRLLMGTRVWTDADRKRQSEAMKAAWKRHSMRRRSKESRRLRRVNGQNLVNIEQMASDEAYRDYQREYKRIYYKQPEKYEKWKRYNKIQNLKRKPLDVLHELYDKHKRNGHDDWAAYVQEAIELKISESIRKVSK
jgi:hypothetical protein